MKSLTVSVFIDAPVERVYRYVSDPENLPRWAPGLCRSVRRVDGEWLVDTSAGPAVFRFVEPNRFGVLDHDVRLPSGQEFHNPMRVVPNGGGSEVMFTLFQSAGMSDTRHAADARLVESDLLTLKRLIEARPAG